MYVYMYTCIHVCGDKVLGDMYVYMYTYIRNIAL